jgi:hypothetical protein
VFSQSRSERRPDTSHTLKRFERSEGPEAVTICDDAPGE